MSKHGWAKIRRQAARFSDSLVLGGVDRRSEFKAEVTPSLGTRISIGRFDAIEDMRDELSNLYIWLWNAKDYLATELHQRGRVQTRRAAKNKVDTYVNRHKTLRIVADVANTEKHAVLTGSRSDVSASIGGYVTVMPLFIEPFSLKATDAEVRRRSRSFIALNDADGNTIGDAVEVASQALTLWQAFVNKHGLCNSVK